MTTKELIDQIVSTSFHILTSKLADPEQETFYKATLFPNIGCYDDIAEFVTPLTKAELRDKLEELTIDSLNNLGKVVLYICMDDRLISFTTAQELEDDPDMLGASDKIIPGFYYQAWD